MKSLIIGSRGLVGSALKKQIPDAIEGIPVEPKKNTNQVYTDVTKYETLFKVFSNHRPDIVYLSAAMAHVDKCEESDGTSVVNVRGAINVLRLCESFEAKLIYYSSSYVFNGEKKDPYTTQDVTCPINRYGIQKEMVERQILQSEAKYVIIRTVGVYGQERLVKNFGKQVVHAIFAGKTVHAPNDQFMNPILSDDLAKVSVKLADKYQGLFHVAGDTCLSKYDFAVRIAKSFNLGYEKLIVPTSTEEMKQLAKRPKNGCLDCTGLASLNIEVPSFDAGLIKFLASAFYAEPIGDMNEFQARK